jgi:NAD+-dependent secondary alcohol dehydrogenase Adh1
MKAVRLHGYHQSPQIDDVPEPIAKGPFDVVVRIGGAGCTSWKGSGTRR